MKKPFETAVLNLTEKIVQMPKDEYSPFREMVYRMLYGGGIDHLPYSSMKSSGHTGPRAGY